LKFSSYIFFFLLLGQFNLYSQQYNFKNYSVADGLSQSQVYGMCEDNRGYIWLGTRGGGVCRFDGKSFVSFTEEDGLVNNYLRCIYQDKKNNLWFGTDEGLSKFDGKKFTNYSETQGLSSRMINDVCENSKEQICIATDEGIILFDGKKIIAYTKKDGLADNKVHCVYTDKQNRLWIGTENGASCFDGTHFINYTTNNGLSANIVSGITEDDAGNIWFATYGGGVCSFDGKKFTKYTVKDGLCNNTILCITNDHRGNMWFGTAIGASCFSLANQSFKTYSDKEGLCGNVVMSIIKDFSGNMWFGSSGGGISRFDGERFIHFNEKNEKIGSWVFAVMQDSDSNIWFGSSNGGATKYDGNIYTTYTGKQDFTTAKVKCIYEDEAHTLWFGTSGDGLYYYNGKVFKHLTKKEGLSSNFVNAIIADGDEKIWIATLSGGLCYYNKQSKKFSKQILKKELASDRLLSLCFDNNKNLCVATQYAGIYKLNISSDDISIGRYTTPAGLDKTTVRSVINVNGKLIAGTAGKGILIIDEKNCVTINKKNGISSNNIYSLITDEEGNLWVGSEKGIDKIEFDIDYKIKHIQHYGKAEGFTGPETSQNAVCKDNKGNLWFGTIDGVTKYNPKEDKINTIAPFTHITGIRLFFDKIEETKYGDSLEQWYPLPVKLVLPYDKNNLSFDFVGINMRNPENVQYTWKLEGADKQWSPATKQQTATYSNLDPGNYIFKVKACNENAVWNEKEQSFEFTILAPLWRTWWFKIISVISILLIMTGVFSWRINHIKRRNETERNKLELQKNIAELEQKALRLQMNPHFIFNALNSIQGFISKNETTEAKRHLAKFSKLMRQILENSRKQFISIEEETAILRNYLDLEKLSSGSAFDYTIVIDENIVIAQTAIPPMIIQPFVENAVLHGLHKKQGGKIDVQFALRENCVVCEVTDNGIGINKAKELKKENQQEHHSTGIEVTEQRLRLLLDVTIGKPVEYIDLSENGINTGTKVIIRLPFINT
jgi:ligand-binding sensor domain-containing protein/two-component sensor histidine kinase